MLNAELSPASLAAAVGVDIKTVGRWLVEDRVPYPVTRIKIARLVGQQETYLWPALLERADAYATTLAQIDRMWPTRTAVSSEVWHELFNRTQERIDILVYAGEFLVETLDLADVLSSKATRGTSIRLLVGDPGGCPVRHRADELDEPWLPQRCQAMAQRLVSMTAESGVQVRLHATTLYASQYRFDDMLLVNTCAFGASQAASPVFSYRAIAGSQLFDFHTAAFDRVWCAAQPMRNDSCRLSQ